MKRGFRGVPRPLLPAMLPVVVDQSAGQADQAVTQPSPSEPLPSSSPPSVIFATTKSEPTPVAESTTHLNSLSPKPDNEPIEHTFEQPSSEHQPLSPRQETEIPQSQDPTHPHVAEERTITVDDLLQLVPMLITKVDSLEKELKQTKLTIGKAIVKFVKKVKKMEVVLKRRHVVLTDSEDEDAKNSSKQGRNLQEEGSNEMVRSIMKDKSEDFKTPTQGKTSGEADISPKGLEAAETLAKVLTQRTKTYTRKVKTRLRRKLDADESKRTKKQIREEQASLAEIVRLQAQEEAKNARKAKLQRQDALYAKRVQDELELSKTQKNRMAQVQEAAKYYTEEDWDSVRAKLEANRDLSNKVLSINFSSDDFAKKVKMGQLKKLKPDELKEEFDKCIEKVEKFIPLNSELEASKLKRTGINLQAEVFKKQKITDVPDVTKNESKNKSESARSDTKEDVEAYMDERVDEPSLEEFQMGSIPQGSAPPAKIVKWQILKTGKKGAYQIIREDHTDVVYVNFPGLLNDLTRDDLKELYRLMMLKYGDSRPKEEYERVLWGDLKTMFDPPSINDVVWSLTHQQKVHSWRYFHSCVVYCLTMEAAHIYMITEVKYPLPSRVCQAMLENRLIGDRKDECKKQTVVANSTTEAEYVAASSFYGQVLWIQNQLLDYGYNFMHTKIFIDNNRKATKSVRLMIEELCKNRQSDLAKTINEEVQLQALVDGKKIIITKSTVRRDLQLEDAEGVDCLPNATIFKQLALMGYDQVGKGFSGRETPLFPTMVVHNQEEMGEGSAIPNDPHHIPTFIQPSPQPQKTQKPRRPKKKDTQVPQSSVPSDSVADEVIYKELDDSLMRAATTASSLEAEQDSGNIIKTRSKATPNEAGSQGTTSGGGPRCQETIGDTIAQTTCDTPRISVQ
ncbi:hypothetical protein Tco_0491482 [Tanacetum coccineum]